MNKYTSNQVADAKDCAQVINIEGPKDPNTPATKGRARVNDLGMEEVEPWPEPVDGAALLNELRSALTKHVVLPPYASETLALWILHTYGFEFRDVTTYLGIVSPEKRCGKTRLLGVLGKLANRAVVAANISPPALFRVIEEVRPTLLIDEADTFVEGNEELRGILNAGYSKEGAYVMRVAPARVVEREPGNETQKTRLARFSCWCPKVMAAIGRLPETLTDRCIVVTLQRKRLGEECERLRNLEPGPMRQRCARFVRDHAERIASLRPELPASLNDRAADIWEPLLSLAELAGGEWPGLAREAAAKLSGETQESSAIAALFFRLYRALATGNEDRIFSRDLAKYLDSVKECPWAEVWKGKPVTERALASVLRPYGIGPRTIWIDGESAKGYVRQDFEEAAGRYALPLVKQWREQQKLTGNKWAPVEFD
jgi:putative DNA primase/helicase